MEMESNTYDHTKSDDSRHVLQRCSGVAHLAHCVRWETLTVLVQPTPTCSEVGECQERSLRCYELPTLVLPLLQTWQIQPGCFRQVEVKTFKRGKIQPTRTGHWSRLLQWRGVSASWSTSLGQHPSCMASVDVMKATIFCAHYRLLKMSSGNCYVLYFSHSIYCQESIIKSCISWHIVSRILSFHVLFSICCTLIYELTMLLMAFVCD